MASSWLKGLKSLTKRIPTDDDLNKIQGEIIEKKRDRGAALVTATALEEGLRRLVKFHMVPLSDPQEDALFGRDAPLSSFSKLIRIAHAFGIIDEKIRRECDIVREVRNAFAHSPCAVMFDTPEIATACRLLDKYYERFEGIDENHPKAYYVGSATRLIELFNRTRQEGKPHPPLTLSN